MIEKSKNYFDFISYVIFILLISYRFEDKDSCRAYEEETESQLVCYTKMLQTM
jgi:hypothetical protein